MDVYATETLAANTRPKCIYIKLVPSTVVTKSRSAAMISVLGHPHHGLDIQQEELNTQIETPASVMIDAARRWFRRNRTPIAIGVGVVGVVGASYVGNNPERRDVTMHPAAG